MTAPKDESRETVRLAGPADAERLARLRFEFRSAIAPPVEREEAFLERCSRWMRERLDRGSAWRCWIAKEDGEIGGAVWLCLLEKVPNPVGEPEGHAYVTNFFVRPALRERGVGSALLGAALSECDRRGVDAVFLWPTPESRSLYERHGFEVRDDLMERRRWHAL